MVLAALAAGCGHPDQLVVDKYFQAVNTGDNNTLGSFALVKFDKKVDRYEIKKTVSENKETIPLQDLVKKQKDLTAQLNDNKKAYNSYFLDHTSEVDQVRNAKKSGDKVPAKLTSVASDWERFTDREKELKKALAEVKSSLDKEKKNMAVSLGNVDDFEGLEGDVLTRQIELALTVEGQPQPYLMTLKKYDVKPSAGGNKLVSRWIIAGLAKA